MSLFSELKRRNVIRVATAYVVAAWLIIQVVETVLPAYGFGDAALRLVIALLAIAFVPALVFSWVFEITPEGLKREVDVALEDSITRFMGKKLDRIITVLLALAVGYFAFDKFVMEPERVAEIVHETAQQARSEAFVESYGDASIAVLPFVNMSADPEQEYFSDGITEELLNLLSKIPKLRVISRSSSFSFKGKNVAIPAIAEQLNVVHLLEGSVRKAGNRVRITVQLIEARSDTHLWSETFDSELTARNIFAIQAEIAESISNALGTVLAMEDRNRLNEVPTRSLQAYEAYLLGKQRMATRTRAQLLEASRYFAKAVELDPLYTLAYVGLADVHLLRGNYGYQPLSQALAEAESALSTAMSLDDQLGAANASLGLSGMLQEDGFGAEVAFKRSIELDPNYAPSYLWYGNLQINIFGQPEAAIPLLRKARELDPLSPVITVTLGEALQGTGKIDEAMKLFRKAVEIEPDYPSAYFLIGMAYLDLGDDSSAQYWIDRGISKWPEELFSNVARVSLHRYRGERTEALQLARRMLTIMPTNNLSLVTLVNYGQYREALETVGTGFPELSCEADPVVTRNNLFQAMNLSLALQESGERACSDRMLDKILARLQELPRHGFRVFGFLDSEVYARQGKKRQALDALRRAIDEGWRTAWWSQVLGSPHMVSLVEDREFKAMIAEIEADMAVQLAHVHEMEANGELAPAPGVEFKLQ